MHFGVLEAKCFGHKRFTAFHALTVSLVPQLSHALVRNRKMAELVCDSLRHSAGARASERTAAALGRKKTPDGNDHSTHRAPLLSAHATGVRRSQSLHKERLANNAQKCERSDSAKRRAAHRHARLASIRAVQPMQAANTGSFEHKSGLKSNRCSPQGKGEPRFTLTYATRPCGRNNGNPAGGESNG
jgi:hypothetical protein